MDVYRVTYHPSLTKVLMPMASDFGRAKEGEYPTDSRRTAAKTGGDRRINIRSDLNTYIAPSLHFVRGPAPVAVSALARTIAAVVAPTRQ